MHETVLLGGVVGGVQDTILLFLLLDDLGAQLVLEGAVTGQIHQERGEDEAGDVNVGEEDFDEGLEKLEEEKKLWLGDSFCSGVLLPQVRSDTYLNLAHLVYTINAPVDSLSWAGELPLQHMVTSQLRHDQQCVRGILLTSRAVRMTSRLKVFHSLWKMSIWRFAEVGSMLYHFDDVCGCESAVTTSFP
jgi:hypothetical protein